MVRRIDRSVIFDRGIVSRHASNNVKEIRDGCGGHRPKAGPPAYFPSQLDPRCEKRGSVIWVLRRAARLNPHRTP